MNNLSGTYCFSHRSFSTTKLPLRKSICSRKSFPYLKQVIFFIFLIQNRATAPKIGRKFSQFSSYKKTFMHPLVNIYASKTTCSSES